MTFINIFHWFSEKIRLDISCESSPRQRIHIKHQALFSSKDKSKKINVSSPAVLFGPLRVKINKNRKRTIYILIRLINYSTCHNLRRKETI